MYVHVSICMCNGVACCMKQSSVARIGKGLGYRSAELQEHSDETNSKVAKYILDNWTSQLSNFKKVMPTDYKRVLLERAQKVQEAVA